MTKPAMTTSGADAPVIVAPVAADRWRRWLPGAAVAVTALVLAAVLAPRIVSWLSPPPASGLLFASGRIEGRITTLTPRSAAIVKQLHTGEGEQVRPGQLLATLDEPAQRQRVVAAQENVSVLVERLRAADTQLGTTERQIALQVDEVRHHARARDPRRRRD